MLPELILVVFTESHAAECWSAGVPRLGLKWCVLQFVSFICLLVSLGAAVGSIAQIVLDTEDYTPFVTNYSR